MPYVTNNWAAVLNRPIYAVESTRSIHDLDDSIPFFIFSRRKTLNVPPRPDTITRIFVIDVQHDGRLAGAVFRSKIRRSVTG